jgi:hypothetical protein
MACRRSADDRSLVAVGSWLVPWEFTGGEVPPVTGKTPRFCRLGSLLRRRKKPGNFVRVEVICKKWHFCRDHRPAVS